MSDPNHPTDPAEAPPEHRRPKRPVPVKQKHPDTLSTVTQREQRDRKLERR